jgi:hypothetical protein
MKTCNFLAIDSQTGEAGLDLRRRLPGQIPVAISRARQRLEAISDDDTDESGKRRTSLTLAADPWIAAAASRSC